MRIVSVQTGRAQRLQAGGRSVLSAIGKRVREGRVALGPLGLEGDEQADPSVHGGLDKALYAYPVEHAPFWREQRRAQGLDLLDEGLPAGFVGENLSVQGLDERALWIGDRLRLPDAELLVSAPREPCFKFNAVMGYAQASRDMARSLRCGFYLQVLCSGSVGAGDAIELVPGSRGLRVSEAFAARMSKHLR